ncbi:hypothetical protein VHA01S_029_00210 [Vibrio halioticoli NBRC 102217]|uniref:DUF3179 domain-containing protein n=1 Tax=Vibrio halioticoli NBRC 102217 TaxID=1219072 RepID=V5FE21_9VIBR|nr:DUF3179 domain-containing (seleno)protein [Vibrio halioticoli]GAD89888.1 hypothetical protein VHA01S_029_00210 [Vibrio halioticoli NBRC 102217]
MKKAIMVLITLSLVIGGLGSVALTEGGQLINMPRDWVFTLFQYKGLLTVAMLLLAVAALWLSTRNKVFSKMVLSLYVVSILGCTFLINWFAPDFWLRSQQHNASFMSVEEADSRLQSNDDVFVLEINGDARAYPRDWMQLPHIAGDVVGGEDTVMTYCALSNLPMAFNPNMNGQPTDFKIIAQVHNNLIFTDRNSGELIQQVTATAEYSQTELEQYPVQRMPWESFKALYPEGQVFNYEPVLYDHVTLKLFDSALEPHYEGEPMFPTLSLEDDRLATGEQVWGVQVGNESVAVTTEDFTEKNQLVVELSNQKILFVNYEEYQTVAAYFVDDSRDWEVTEVDPYGSHASGKLERVNLYSGMPWMVWSHWFPETQLVNKQTI